MFHARSATGKVARKDNVVPSFSRSVRAAAAAVSLAGLAAGTSQVLVAPAAMARYGPVRATASVNIRSGPSTSTSILGVLHTGATAQQVGAITRGFVPVAYAGRTAYIAASYLSGTSTDAAPTSSASGTKTSTAWATDVVNVRSGPSLSASVVARLAKGESVQRTGTTSGQWVQVNFKGATRWVFGSYLTSTAPAPASSGSSATGVKITGQARTTTPLMIRTAPGTNFKSLGDLPTGTIVSLTGKTSSGVSQIVWQGALRWVNSSFLVAVSKAVGVVSTQPPKTIGTRYATTTLDIRSAANSATSNVVDEVPVGTGLAITGTVSGGFAQIVYQGAARWVTAQYLSASKPSTSSIGAAVVAYAYAQLGKPYVWGGNGPNGFDCSGLTQQAYKSAGVSIPRVTYDQLTKLSTVAKADLQPGDIVGFYSGGHVGIYVGDGYIIHAPHTGDVVRKVPITYMPYYKSVRP